MNMCLSCKKSPLKVQKKYSWYDNTNYNYRRILRWDDLERFNLTGLLLLIELLVQWWTWWGKGCIFKIGEEMRVFRQLFVDLNCYYSISTLILFFSISVCINTKVKGCICSLTFNKQISPHQLMVLTMIHWNLVCDYFFRAYFCC